MQRFHQSLFAISLLALCWLLMMAVHELGHVLGAWATGGKVVRVVLHPLAISRTDVAPNPHPGIVVWLGPIIGVGLPLAMASALPRSKPMLRGGGWFFAGFCLIANGAYISLGSFEGIGDCGEMLRNGAPQWTLLAFGAVAVPLGLYVWHSLGSPQQFWRRPEIIAPRLAYSFCAVLVVLVMVEAVFAAR